MINFIESLSNVIAESLSKLDAVYTILFSVFIILIVVFGSVIIYIYKQMRADSKTHAVELNKNFTALISVHEKTNESINGMTSSVKSLDQNIAANTKATESLSNLIITKIL